MAGFTVSVGGSEYDVDAPDEATAWKWARAEHLKGIKSEGQAVKPPTPFRSSYEKTPSDAEAALGNPMLRGLYGATEPAVGLVQKFLNMAGQGDRLNVALADQERTMQAARENVGSTGFDAFRFGGNAGSPIYMALAGKLPPTQSALGRIGQGAGVGALAGFSQPVYDPTAVGSQTASNTVLGAILGGALPAGWEAAKAGGRAVRNVVQPYIGEAGADAAAGRLANKVAGDKADEIIALLQNPRELTPGSRPTAGQAAVDANSAEFSALQRLAAEKNPSAYYGPKGIEGDQAAARLSAVRGVGGTPDQLAADEARRSATGAANYAEAGKETVKADGLLRSLLSRPSMEKALARAEEIAKERNIPFAIKRDAPEQVVQSKLLGADGRPASTTVIPATAAEFPVSSLHSIKMALDDMVKNPDLFGIGASEVKAIADTRGTFMKWLEGKSPKYQVARETYAAQSVPINQKQVGQELEKRLTQAVGEEAPQRATAFANAMREAPQTIKKATGQPRFDDLSQILNPRQMEAMQGVLDDLNRNGVFDRLAKAGMPKARELIGQAVPEAPPSGMFSPIVSVTRGAYNRLAGNATDKIMSDLARNMTDPQKLARLMAEAKPAERSAIIDYLARMQAAAIPAAVQGGR